MWVQWWGYHEIVRTLKPYLKRWPHRASVLTLVVAHINLYLDNLHQASTSYPFSSIDASVNTDDARCGQGIMQNNLFELFALTGGEDAKTLGVSHPVKLPLTFLDLVSSRHIFL